MNGFPFVSRIIGEIPKTEGRRHMKKLFKTIVTTGFIIAVCGTMSFVSKAAHGCISAVNRNGFCADYYLDIDGDGICDDYGSGRHCANAEHCDGYLDADGNGICDDCGFGNYGQMTSDGNGSCNTATVLNETVHHNEHINGYGYTGVQGSTGGHGHSSGHGHSGKHGHSH